MHPLPNGGSGLFLLAAAGLIFYLCSGLNSNEPEKDGKPPAASAPAAPKADTGDPISAWLMSTEFITDALKSAIQGQQSPHDLL